MTYFTYLQAGPGSYLVFATFLFINISEDNTVKFSITLNLKPNKHHATYILKNPTYMYFKTTLNFLLPI